MKTRSILLLSLLGLCTLPAAPSTAEAQGTAFTYQGQLSAGGAPANGGYDFTFALFNNSSANTGQIGGALTNLDVPVSNGLFTVQLDFGPVFAGNAAWLAIGVRSNGGVGFTALGPLQELTPTPYALYAPSAGSVAASNIIGVIAQAQLPAVAASNITGTISLAQLPGVLFTNGATGVSLSGNLTNTSPQSVQRGVSSFVTGLHNLGLWTNLIEAAWFSPGQNYMSPGQLNPSGNLIGIVQNPLATGPNGLPQNVGLASNCTQVASGLLFSGANSFILFSNIPPQSGPMTLIVFFTQEGWLQPAYQQNNVAFYTAGAFASTTNVLDYLRLQVFAGWECAVCYDGINGYTVIPSYAGGWSFNDSLPHCVAFSTDRTNLTMAQWGSLNLGATAWNSSNVVMNPSTRAIVNEIVLGANGNYSENLFGVIHGFVAVSNYLSLAQIQQVFYLAANTVLPWRRVIFEGDSLAFNLYQDLNLTTNNDLWGNCDYCATAVGGTTIEQIVNRFYPALATNMPNGLDIIYPSTVIFWGGQNSLASDTAAQIEADIQWEVNAVHACGSQIYISTPTESQSITTVPACEATRVALKAWELSGASGADGVVDNDTMFFNFFGTNYYTNLSYFDGVVHPNAAGNALVASNFAAVIGTNILTPNNLFVGWPLQSILNSAVP
ncbi:MAG: SGNH/GDSL hydrolase family protein [Verrucomicrobiota bacterium]|jgi:hypothetical protein